MSKRHTPATVSLFDPDALRREGPARYGEPSFPYLNESGRPAFGACRRLLDDWFMAFPQQHRADLRQRFRSKDDRHHEGAFFELYLHALSESLGFEVEAHPASPSRGNPDFRLSLRGTPLTYLEGTVASPLGHDPGAVARKERIHQTLNAQPHPNFMLGVCVERVPARDVARAELVPPVQAWLDGLDPDAPRRDTMPWWPRKVLQGADWRVVVDAIPRKVEKRGTPLGGAIGTLGPYGGHIDPAGALREALRRKAHQLPDLGLPLIVAVNCRDTQTEDWAVAAAVFGTEQLTVEMFADGSERTSEGRVPDGAWWQGKPVNTRISAVLVVRGVDAWSVAQREPVLWLNPWSERPLPPDSWPLSTRVPDHSVGKMVTRPAAVGTIARVFGLPDDWPGPD